MIKYKLKRDGFYVLVTASSGEVATSSALFDIGNCKLYNFGRIIFIVILIILAIVISLLSKRLIKKIRERRRVLDGLKELRS